ncbi:MAG: hypothetical protein K6F20_06605 [Bacteroidaceae bacterium]|nr:hypothetical protein [Bacteroidaceae bacterium]
MKKITLFLACSIMYGLTAWAQVPKADVLDIQFNDDGTITDASPMQNPVTIMGAPRIAKSTQFNMNVLCQSDEHWGYNTPNYVRIDRNEQLDAAIADGVTLETLARPYFAGGKFSNDWVNIFGGFQGGGIGLIIYNGVYDFEANIGGYKDAVNDSQPVANEWVHLMGVWSPEEGTMKLFINGQLAGQVNGVSDGLTTGSNSFYALGVDYEPGSSSLAGNTFTGDIALARIYDKPLTDEEVAAVYADVQARKGDTVEHSEEPELRCDADGTALIATTEELYNFGRAVRQGNTSLNARLEADVTYAGRVKMLSTDQGYAGTFDGQDHTLTLGLERENNEAAMFNTITNATIKNLTVKGEIATSGKYAAALASHATGSNTISRVGSSIAITSNLEGDGTHGGLLGVNDSGNTTIEYCYFDGSITGEQTNCCGGFVGYSHGTTVIRNSLLTAEFVTSQDGCCTFGRNPANVRISDSYYTQAYGDENAGAALVDLQQLSSGEACWLLNGSRPGTGWYQSLPDDNQPTLDPAHGIVVSTGSDYMSIQDEASLKAAATAYAGALHSEADALEAYQPLIDKLQADLELLAAAPDVETFLALNQTVDDDFAAIAENQAAYGRFTEAAEHALAELGDLDNAVALLLKDYLNESIEPGGSFPQGSYIYILENFSLSTEDVNGQIDYINEMLEKAMSNDVPAGTDITLLLTNADFAQGDAGWEGTPANNYTSNPVAGQWYGYTEAAKTQTLTGLKNGLYEFCLNSFNMVGDDNYSTYYTGVIQANGVEIPVMAPMEDPISVEDAVEGVNSWSDDRLVDGQYNIPYSRYGGAVAMSAGRYLNRVMVEVTDGTLTVGFRLYGSGASDDWFMFANARLYYQGTIEEAGEALNTVLDGALARAHSTLDYQADMGGTNYLVYPNYSQALRDELSAAVSEAEAATELQAKYASLVRLSDLFKQIYVCRKAYRQMAIDIIRYFESIPDYPDYIDIIQDKSDKAWTEWGEGSLSAEEALAHGQALIDEMATYTIEIPVADLLDVVFNADGTATDISPAANEVVAYGTPKIVESQALGMNVLCHTQAGWSTSPKDYFRVINSDALTEGIGDGMAMEIYTRPYWTDEDNIGDWCSLLGHEEGGGVGMLVYNNQWCFEVHAGGYQDAYSGFAPQKGEWTHLVGSWNQETGTVSLYVNGEFVGSANASGSFGRPNISPYWFGIGCDPQGDGNPSASYKGDIAIARIYDKPVNTAQAALLYKNVQAKLTGLPEHSEEGEGIHGIAQDTPQRQAIYTLTGQRVDKPTHGIYIINGKRVLVK